MLAWGKYGPKPPFRVKIELSQFFGNRYSSRRLRGQRGNLRLRQFPTDIRTLLMTLLIAQIRSPRIDQIPQLGRDKLIKSHHAMRPGREAVHQLFWRTIAWMKMSRSHRRLRFEPPRYINPIMLHSMVPRVGGHNMGHRQLMKRLYQSRLQSENQR